MARVNAQQWLEKWGRRLSAAGPDIASGVDRVKQAPGEKAAAAQDLMLQRLTEAITSGVWARNTAAVSLESWQTSMKKKGIPRIAQGVAGAQANKQGSITALLAAVDTAAAAAHALPKGDIEASIARAAAFMRSMKENAPKRRGIK